MSGGKHNTAHFVWRCGLCMPPSFLIIVLERTNESPRTLGKRESSAKFDNSSKIQPYNDENAQLKPLLIVECRGLEFIGFDPRVRESFVVYKATVLTILVLRVLGNVSGILALPLTKSICQTTGRTMTRR